MQRGVDEAGAPVQRQPVDNPFVLGVAQGKSSPDANVVIWNHDEHDGTLCVSCSCEAARLKTPQLAVHASPRRYLPCGTVGVQVGIPTTSDISNGKRLRSQQLQGSVVPLEIGVV